MKIRKILAILWLGCTLFLCGSVAAEDLQPEPNMTLYIPMRDGVELPTDIFLPEPTSKGLPCILIRTPCSRTSTIEDIQGMTEWGYVVAVQDARNVIDSEGKELPYFSDAWGERQDGYDTTEWLARQDITNGKIGTTGRSALGIMQLLMAPTAPPSLCCQYISLAPPSLFQYGIYQGGQLRKEQVEEWLGDYCRTNDALCHVLGKPFYNEFWAKIDAVKEAAKVTTPAIHCGGWYDTFLQGTIDAFVSRQEQGGEGAKGTQKLVIGPWTHYSTTTTTTTTTTTLGDFELPEQSAKMPFDYSEKSWFDFHLKGEKNAIANLAPVSYYVMGPFDGSASSGNVWKTADSWPVPADETSFYLTSAGGLQTDISLEEEKTAISYLYDPSDPTPTVGGRNFILESGPKDQREIESRDDMLVFTSKPLEADLEVTGRLKAKIFFSSNQQDTDVAVRLCDVYPDGRSVLITDGISHLAAELTADQMQIFQQGNPVEVDVDLWSTSLVFAKGHQIRVSVSSANYPRFERNPNSGSQEPQEPRVARNRVQVGKDSRSRIILPVVHSS